VSLDGDLYVVTDRQLTGGRPLRLVVEAALRGGVRAIQLREKDLPPRDLYSLALDMRQLTQAYGARLLINDRVDVALAVKADGVHLATTSLPARIAEAQAAAEQGADFVVFGPVFFTPSKAPYGQPVGLDALRAVRAAIQLPILAIGGITQANLDQVIGAGADGIAVISAIICAEDPTAAGRALLATLHAARARMATQSA
jgi:thiamine-phosphate pyrophosphorylase